MSESGSTDAKAAVRMISEGPPPGMDRRTWRTRQLLAQALIDLGAEHGVDSIEVGALAETAGVARSTFYAHYASKQDFLTGSFVNMISTAEKFAAEQTPERADLVASMPLFAHVAASRDFATSLPKSREYPAMMEAGEARVREIVEANLARLKPDWPAARRRETAVYVAGGFMGLLRWWMESGGARSAQEMQAAFTRLTHSALESG